MNLKLPAIAVSVTAVSLVVLALSNCTGSHGTGRVDAGKLTEAVAKYAGDQQPGDRPQEVSVQTLIANGYLAAEDVSGFQGMEVTISLEEQSSPQQMLVRARLPDGSVHRLMADGSVQSRR